MISQSDFEQKATKRTKKLRTLPFVSFVNFCSTPTGQHGKLFWTGQLCGSEQTDIGICSTKRSPNFVQIARSAIASIEFTFDNPSIPVRLALRTGKNDRGSWRNSFAFDFASARRTNKSMQS